MNKENIASTPTFTRKRAKSFSTPPTTKPASKLARGILKGANGDDAHTIAFIPIHSPSKKKTESAEKRRKSLSRRVSFASHASVRLFEKPGESPEAPKTTPRRSARHSPAKSPIRQIGADFIPGSPSTRANVTNDSNDEITMDLTELLPRPSSLLKQSNPLTRSVEDDDDDDDDDDDSSADDSNVYIDADGGEDDTAAMDLTDILPAPSNAVRMPQASRIPRLSMSPKKRSTAEIEAEDDSMDLTRPVGQLNHSMSQLIEADADMDMTRIVGGIIRQAQSATISPTRKILQPKLVSQNLLSPSKDDADETVNMDETRVFGRTITSPTKKDYADEPTSHTSYTVATEEDDTQRLCEGSVTQADGFTQNMDFTKIMPNRIAQPGKGLPHSVGFAWGASVPVNPEDVDVSMADVTQNDETTMNMDMTQAVAGRLLEQSMMADMDSEADQTAQMDMTRVLSNTIENEADESVEMDMTRIVPREELYHGTKDSTPKKAGSTPSRRPTSPAQTPRKSVTREGSRSPQKQTPKQTRRLSSGAVRTPVTPAAQDLQNTSTSNLKSGDKKPIVPRRKSLLENEVPTFGTPEAKVLTAPDSSKRAEFGANLVGEDSLRITSLKDRIQSLTPKKPVSTTKNTPTRTQAGLNLTSASKTASEVKTPQKTPQRSLLVAQNSIARTNSISTPSSKVDRATPGTPLSPIVLKDFLKLTGISFLTGLSTTRRRETIALPATLSQAGGEEGSPQATDLYTIPMLEMYQHSCRELTKYITEGRAMCDEIEADMNDQNPEIFEQYRRASPAEKRDLEASFKQLKTVARLSAKGVWYVWRENLLSGVLVPLRKNLADLEQEHLRLKAEDEQTLPVYEEAKKEYEALKAKVEQLLHEEDEYESFDHEEAARLSKTIAEDEAAIAEQEAQLLHIDAEIAAMQAEKEALDEVLRIEEAEVKAMEEEAERCRGYSRAEIADFKERYETFTQKTGYRLEHVNEQEVRLILKDTLSVVLTISSREVSISLAQKPICPAQTIMQYYAIQIAQSLKELSSEALPYRELLAFIREQWTLVLSLIAEVDILESAHPIDVMVNEDDNILVTAHVFLPASKTKFVVNFTSTPLLTADECSLEVVVNVKYGGLDGGKIQQHISSRLLSRQSKAGHGWLLESLKMPEGL